MTTRLVLCPACSRHIRMTEASCPFCRAVLPDEARVPVPLPQLGGRNLSRAALLVASAAAAAACGKETKPPPDAEVVEVVEAAPPPPTPQPNLALPPYGVPPYYQFDAAVPSRSDAGNDRRHLPVPPYGVSPTQPRDGFDDTPADPRPMKKR